MAGWPEGRRDGGMERDGGIEGHRDAGTQIHRQTSIASLSEFERCVQ